MFKPYALTVYSLLLAGFFGVAGCANHASNEAGRLETLRVTSADGDAARQYLLALADLESATPSSQAEILQQARDLAESAPTTSHRLRYALYLADPVHSGTDPVAARRHLSEILSRPEWLLPSERALAQVTLAQLDSRLALMVDVDHRQKDVINHDRDRVVVLNKKLSAELEENSRLKKLLDEASKKLDAVLQLERR